jgi:hypothetical protein
MHSTWPRRNVSQIDGLFHPFHDLTEQGMKSILEELSFDDDLGKIEENSCKMKAEEYWMSWVGVYLGSGFDIIRQERSVSSPLLEFNRRGSRYCAS